MPDLVTYVPDLLAMNAEGHAIAADPEHPLNELFDVDDDGNLTFHAFKYVHYYGMQTLGVARVDRAVIEQTTTIQVLGVVNSDGSYTFDSVDAETIYDNLRGDLRHEDEDGNVWYEPRWLMALA